MTPKPQPSFSWDQIDALRQQANQAPPPGAITIAQYAEKYHMTLPAALSELRRYADAGKLKTGLFRTFCGGRNQQIRYYWVG